MLTVCSVDLTRFLTVNCEVSKAVEVMDNNVMGGEASCKMTTEGISPDE